MQTHPVVLIGDGMAFWYPFRQLRYRTVFDVDTSGTQDVAQAWMGAERVPSDAVVVVDRGELARFARTYRGIPSLDDDSLRRIGATVIFKPTYSEAAR